MFVPKAFAFATALQLSPPSSITEWGTTAGPTGFFSKETFLLDLIVFLMMSLM
jgi:hypothetical protein